MNEDKNLITTASPSAQSKTERQVVLSNLHFKSIEDQMDLGTTKRNDICVNETIKDENVKEINHLHQHADNNLGIQ